MITLTEAELIRCHLPLVRPFRTSFGVQEVREAVLLRVVCDVDGAESQGWGECVAGKEPLYSSEWADGAWILLRDVLVPMMAHEEFDSLPNIPYAMEAIKGNRMAKATVEMAMIDAILRARGQSLRRSLGGVRDRVECGVSIGIAPSIDALLDQVAGYLTEGYRRIKLKIEPHHDVEIVEAVRAAHPDVMLTVDANAAYSLDDEDVERLGALDDFGLAMIEQPLPKDDVAGHAELAQHVKTPLCLDESIVSASAARAAIEAGACRIVNVKQGRLGGLMEALWTHNVCTTLEVPVWCGGMLETGIGRAANLALASLPGFSLPGDTSASRRYFHEDLTEPFEMAPDGTMAVPEGPGLGVEPLDDMLAKLTVARETIEW